jgi:hypothetical protein
MPDDKEMTAIVSELREVAKAGLRIQSFVRRQALLNRVPLLGQLPAVSAAGADATARFEYLAQAISDSIDDLSRAGSEPGQAANGHHPEANALRNLFGLTEETRRASWRTRQESAARQLHITWDHFRHQVQMSLLCAVAERLLAHAAAHVRNGERFPSGIKAYPPQADVESALIAYIRRWPPKRADLLELSTATMLPVLRTLRDVGCVVRLLVADPHVIPATVFMRERMRRALAELMGGFRNDPGVVIRVYRTAPALRGRYIGRAIAVGWYTYRDNSRLDLSEGETTEIWGHDNALIVADTSDENGATLAAWFEREYDRLWHHRLTHDSSALDDC